MSESRTTDAISFQYVSPTRPLYDLGWEPVTGDDPAAAPEWRVFAGGSAQAALEALARQADMAERWEAYATAVSSRIQQPRPSAPQLQTADPPAEAVLGLFEFVERSLREPLVVATYVDDALLARTTLRWDGTQDTVWSEKRLGPEWLPVHTQAVAIAGRTALALLQRETAVAAGIRRLQEQGVDGVAAWTAVQSQVNTIEIPSTSSLDPKNPEISETDTTSEIDTTIDERYSEFLLQCFQYVDFRGMGVSDRVALKLPLVEMYVPLRARIELPKGDTWTRDLRVAGRPLTEEEAERIGQRVSDPLPVLDLLKENDGLIVLGDPGAGKTMFMKFLALRLARGEGTQLSLGKRLPVIVPLSAYANALAEGDIRLQTFLAQYYDDQGIDLPVGVMLDEALRQGGALLLLDGLDEVKQLDLRHVVVDRVIEFFNFHKGQGNKFVLTSRIVGYREVRPAATVGLAECTLVDFDDEEIALFIDKWTQAIERAARGDSAVSQARAATEKDELLSAIARNEGVRRLAANPLLLSILALMKRQGVTLPERRVELYDRYVYALLKTWNLARGLGRPPTRDLDVLETVRVLAPLALWMHERSPDVGLVSREEVRRMLEIIYAERGVPEPEKMARQLLLDVREYAGLLVERGEGMVGFIHLTFQEYLAAVAIAQKGQSDVQPVVDVLAAHVGDDNWHEVMLLTIGHLGIVQQRDQAAGDVLVKLVRAAPGEPGVATVWAGESVDDAWPGGVTQGHKLMIVNELVATMQNVGVAVPLRARAGRVLGKLGDPRLGVWTFWREADRLELPDIAWGKTVPPGSYRLPKDDRAYSSFETRTVTIAEPYQLSRYPVTFAQFECFVRARDFDDPRWWEGMPEEEEVYGTTYKLRELSEQVFPYANHPRECVSWYQAMAFCRWLNDKLDDGTRINLPHEDQWEVAARYSDAPVADGRAYPWGDTFDARFANTDEGEKVGQTTAVGMYPQGKQPNLELYDLSGNVWEWCRNKYRDPTIDVPDSSRESRAIRGGSWSHNLNGARVAYRAYNNPDTRNNSYGLRLVRIVTQLE